LCGVPLGASDYLRIAREFHTLIVDRVPVMDFDRRNEAKRFIALIDMLYDHAVKLIASADAAPHELYRASDGFEAAEFQRTASRLIEMGSQSYLALPHGTRAGDVGGEALIDT
jgi:cell division protein ZapE